MSGVLDLVKETNKKLPPLSLDKDDYLMFISHIIPLPNHLDVLSVEGDGESGYSLVIKESFLAHSAKYDGVPGACALVAFDHGYRGRRFKTMGDLVCLFYSVHKEQYDFLNPKVIDKEMDRD